MVVQMSLEDGRTVEKTFTIFGKKKQFKEIFNLFNIEKLSLDDHLQLYYTLLKGFGLNFLSEKYFKSFYPILGFLSVFQHTIFLISGIVYIRNNREDLGKVTECSTTQLLALVIGIKVGILSYQKHNINDLISRMRYEYTQIVSGDGSERKILSKRFLEGRIVTRGFLFATVLTSVLFSIIPFVSSEEYLLPLPNPNFLLQEQNLRNYIINYILQLIMMVYVVTFFSAYEALCIYLVMMLCAKMEILSFRIRQFGIKKEFYNLTEPGSSEYADLRLMDKEYAENYITKIIEAHQSIYRMADDFNEAYQFDFFIELVFSVIIGCLSLVQITEKSGSDIIPFLAYLIVCIFQIFLFCWYGDLVYQKSAELPIALYDTKWYLMCPSLRKTFHIILMRSQKSINVSGIFTYLTLEVFTQVIRGMYSFYNILVQSE